jgi:hypothetical protein
MTDIGLIEGILAGAVVDAAVFALRPDYRSLLLAVDGLVPSPSDEGSDALLQTAEDAARQALSELAVDQLHQIPLGGEDLTRYAGSPRLIRATGSEPFDTVADGAAAIEHPDPGEVVWCDATGVTCRRWNWRQARRTQLRDDTTTALCILDALDPMTDEALHTAADDLVTHLTRLGPDVHVVRRVIACGTTPEGE